VVGSESDDYVRYDMFNVQSRIDGSRFSTTQVSNEKLAAGHENMKI